VLTFRGAILETNAADEATEVTPKRSEILELTPLSSRFTAKIWLKCQMYRHDPVCTAGPFSPSRNLGVNG
jgi:hypothetical protein